MSKLKGCIYLISNLVNGKRYVGQDQSGDPENHRWKDHIKAALDKDSQYPLHRAIRKYGLKNFSAEVIWRGLTELLDIKEILHIMNRRSYVKDSLGDCSYNLTRGGDGVRGLEWSKKSKENHSVVQRRRFENPIEREKSSVGQLRRYEDPVARRKVGEATKRVWAQETPSQYKAHCKAMSNGQRRRYEDPKERVKTGNASKGRIHTAATRIKIGDANRCRVWTKKMRLANSAAHKGKPGHKHTEATRLEMSVSKKTWWAGKDIKYRHTIAMRTVKTRTINARKAACL